MGEPSHLNVKPSEFLVFERPGEQLVTVEIELENSQVSPVLFKVKTTAPKRYIVRPNHGEVAPGATKTVSVILQQMSQDELKHPCKDKFLIQTCVVPPSGVSNPDHLWTSAAIGTVKLRCMWSTGGDFTPPQSLATSTKQQASSPSQPQPANAPATSPLQQGKSVAQADPTPKGLQALKVDNAELTVRNTQLRKDLEAKKRGMLKATAYEQPFNASPQGLMKDQQIALIVILVLGFLVGRYFL